MKAKKLGKSTHKSLAVWQIKEDAGLYTIIDFLKGMTCGNGTMQKWCAILSAFDYKINIEAV